MSHANAADAYLEARVLTAAPHQLHLMVVDAAIRHGRKAAEALQARDFEVSFFALSKSRECLDDLIFGLNYEAQPELSESMKQLFLFVHRAFRMADLTHEQKYAEDGVRILEMHRENWLLAIERAAQETPAPPASPPATEEGPRTSFSLVT